MSPRITYTRNGCQIYGEDFVTACSPLNSATNWSTVAGFPVAPYALGPNALADLSRTYSEYRFNKLAVLYVPAVGTGANGQVAIYHKKDRTDPGLDPNGAAFFNYVLSQKSGIIGPVWQPMGIEMPCSSDFRSTVPYMGVDPNDEADGEIFIATNNSLAGVAPSVGIIKIQYVVEFRGMSRNPRLSLIPTARQVYFNLSFGSNGVPVLTSSSVKGQLFGNDQSGGVSTVTPQRGDIIKFNLDLTKSSLGTLNAGNFMNESAVGAFFSVTLENGFTMYLWYDGTNYYPCKSFIAANNANTYFNGTNNSAVWNLVGMGSVVGNTNTTIQQDL